VRARRFLVENRKELPHFPSLDSMTDAEMEEKLLKALDGGKLEPLAYRTHPHKPQNKLLHPDHKLRKDKTWFPDAKDALNLVDRNSKKMLEAFRTYYADREVYRAAENRAGIDKIENALCVTMQPGRQSMLQFARHADAKGGTINRIDILHKIKTRGAVAAVIVEIGAIRVSQYDPNGSKDAAKLKKKKKKEDDFWNVSVQLELTEVLWAFDGKPYTSTKEESRVSVFDLEEPDEPKRKSDDSDDDDDAMAGVDLTSLDDRPSKKQRNGDDDDLESGDI
jgi:hypothetical protein